MLKITSKDFNPPEWNFYYPPDVPSQILEKRSDDTVGGNCGVHICSWAFIIASGIEFYFTENNMNDVRRSIANVLYFYKSKKLNTKSYKHDTCAFEENRAI